MNGRLNSEQWAIVEEIGCDLKHYSDFLLGISDDDPYTKLLAEWSHVLALLAWEMYDSTIQLVRARRLRSAFALGRSLLDYSLRLNFYLVNAESQRGSRPYVPGELFPGRLCVLVDTFAWKDWHNMWDKMQSYTIQFPLDYSDWSELEQKEIDRMLASNFEYTTRTTKKMFAVFPGSQAELAELRAEYGLRSGYLHCDQTAVFEMLREFENRASCESSFSEHRVAGINAQLALLLMMTIGRATGRFYADDVLLRKLVVAFPATRNRRGAE